VTDRALGRLDGCVLDTDGVITRTAEVHFAAWKQVFEDALGGTFTEQDYLRLVDGRPRYDGVAAVLADRGVQLEWGAPSDPPDRETVCGLGNRKNAAFRAVLERDGVAPYASTVDFVRDLRAVGVAVAAVSASENQLAVLDAAGVADLFDARVDGVVARQLGLPGKPDPALFLEATARLGVSPAVTAVVEDARAGVEAGRRGGFVPVIGVDRMGQADDLLAAGADVVIRDLRQLFIDRDRTLHVSESMIAPGRVR
jgi:HAD superfamily hydrolase (TIGR01509 family)